MHWNGVRWKISYFLFKINCLVYFLLLNIIYIDLSGISRFKVIDCLINKLGLKMTNLDCGIKQLNTIEPFENGSETLSSLFAFLQ